MPGGVLRGKSWSLCGPQAENAMRDLQADLLFLGVDSLDPEIGLMTPHVLEAQLNAQMIRIARTVVAVTDSSKLLRRNLSVIAPLEAVDILITDRGADAGCIEAIRDRGVEVRLV
jgi:DeoR family transcriptional regulator of aga operon